MSKEIYLKNILPLRSRLLGIARGMLYEEQDAEDAVQDTLVKILCLDIFIEPDKLRAFMYRTSIRTYINSYNRSKHYQKIIKNLEKELETAAFLVESSPLPKIIEQLPPYYKELLNAYYYENCSTKQLAEYFECSLSKIKIDLYRARKKLKKQLEKAGYDQWLL